jgi:hypothetical protein
MRTPPQQQFAHAARVQALRQVGELHRIVGAERFRFVRTQGDVGGQTFRRGLREHVGQVVLALRVRGAERGQPAAQRRGIGSDHAGVDLADGALGRAGVLVFDDGGDMALRIAHDTPIAARVGKLGSEHGQRAMGMHQHAQGRGARQRHVAVKHQHARVVGNAGQGLHHRMAGAELLRLFGPAQVGHGRECRAHLVAAVAVDDMDRRRSELARDADHPRQHRHPADRLQHLRQSRRLHALALAGGKDHDVQRLRGHADSGQQAVRAF